MHVRPAALLAVLFLLATNIFAVLTDTTQPYWIFFNDKGYTTEAEHQAALAQAQAALSPDALARRQLRGMLDGALVNDQDIPIASPYLGGVLDTGAGLRQTVPWLNAISVNVTPGQLASISNLPFVRSVQPVAMTSAGPQAVVPAEFTPAPAGPGQFLTLGTADFYGSASAQLNQISIPAVHALGYTGTGVKIGILDTGFIRTHEAFNQTDHVIDIRAEYDFIDNDADTAGPYGRQYEHGTWILGTIGAYKPNTLVGGAYDASFLLAKTEDTTREVPVEEDDWVAGLLFLEANGADLVTSSLGYIDWYTQSQLNGNTAVTTTAAVAAAARGVAIINAAGNYGHVNAPFTSHLIAPADGDLVITVGAVDSGGVIASFSSSGPTADGRLKPEVLAMGVGTATVNAYGDTGVSTVSGTSLSTPLVASAVALIIQAHPNWTVPQIRLALFSTATQATSPDTQYYIRGYGIINTLAAINYQQAVPEPSVVMLLVCGAGLLVWHRRR